MTLGIAVNFIIAFCKIVLANIFNELKIKVSWVEWETRNDSIFYVAWSNKTAKKLNFLPVIWHSNRNKIKTSRFLAMTSYLNDSFKLDTGGVAFT